MQQLLNAFKRLYLLTRRSSRPASRHTAFSIKAIQTHAGEILTRVFGSVTIAVLQESFQPDPDAPTIHLYTPLRPLGEIEQLSMLEALNGGLDYYVMEIEGRSGKKLMVYTPYQEQDLLTGRFFIKSHCDQEAMFFYAACRAHEAIHGPLLPSTEEIPVLPTRKSRAIQFGLTPKQKVGA